jgi:AcrR family transcriptional regulator
MATTKTRTRGESGGPSPRGSTAGSSGDGTAERTRLSKDAVVERGLAIADAEGLDALTIRRLANELGVTPMALYWHFRSKEALLTGLADRIWAEIDTDTDP